MESIIPIAIDYGLAGLGIIGLGWLFIKNDKNHRDEKRRLEEQLGREHAEALEVTKNNTTVLTEIATLIKSK